MALSDDNAAQAFAKAISSDILREGANQYKGWTMAVKQGARARLQHRLLELRRLTSPQGGELFSAGLQHRTI
jgi:hypothetical protein